MFSDYGYFSSIEKEAHEIEELEKSYWKGSLSEHEYQEVLARKRANQWESFTMIRVVPIVYCIAFGLAITGTLYSKMAGFEESVSGLVGAISLLVIELGVALVILAGMVWKSTKRGYRKYPFIPQSLRDAVAVRSFSMGSFFVLIGVFSRIVSLELSFPALIFLR